MHGAHSSACRYKPRLTAANYRYFIRGQSERAGADDFAVQARAKANLQLYDRLLRRFRCEQRCSSCNWSRTECVLVALLVMRLCTARESSGSLLQLYGRLLTRFR